MIHSDILTSALEDAYAAWEVACDRVDALVVGTPEWLRASEVAGKAHDHLYALELVAAAFEGVLA